MAEIEIPSTAFGSELMQLLDCEAIEPGKSPSYEICKVIYEYHPLGAKLVEAPIKMAMSQPRQISVSGQTEDRVRDAFQEEWKEIGADQIIFNVVKQARIYGVAALVMLVKGEESTAEIKLDKLANASISFNVFDPLITSGSLVFNQSPNAVDFQKPIGGITAQGVNYHTSKCIVQLNEQPIYLAWTNSAFGYSGRSVYQRTLYPLKSFLQSMKTDDMVTRKAGIIVAKLKQAGSIVSAAMQAIAGVKRSLLKEARTDNVLSIDIDEEITSIDLQHVNTAMSESRKNILNNIAAGAGMPAILINEETFAEGFGEGTEDARHVALYIEDFRKDLTKLYEFFDMIVQYRAWNKEFFETMQNEFPEEYKKKDYQTAFYEWMKSFNATWPSLLTEPESEKAKKDEIKLEGITSLLEIFLPIADPDNKADIIQWAVDNFNSLETLFSIPLMIDAEAMAEYEPPQPELGMPGEGGAAPGGKPPGQQMPKPPKPKAIKDAQVKAAVDNLIKLGKKKAS